MLLTGPDEQQALLFELAAILRNRGVRIEVDVTGLSPEGALEYARRKDIPKVVRVVGERNGKPQVEAAFTSGEPWPQGVDELLGA